MIVRWRQRNCSPITLMAISNSRACIDRCGQTTCGKATFRIMLLGVQSYAVTSLRTLRGSLLSLCNVPLGRTGEKLRADAIGMRCEATFGGKFTHSEMPLGPNHFRPWPEPAILGNPTAHNH